MSQEGFQVSVECPLDERVWEGLEYLESVAGPGAVVEMIDHFERDLPDRVQRMRVQLERGDLQTLARLAHDLKSNCLTLGVPRLSCLGAAIEAAAEQGSPEALPPLIDEAEALIPSAITAVERRGSSFTSHG